VEQNVVIENAEHSQEFAQDRHDRHAGEEQEGQQQRAQHRAHLPVEIVRQKPVGDLHGADRADVLEPVSPAEIRVTAGSADERLCDEVSYGEGVGVAIVAECVELVALLSVLDPNLLVTHDADEHQACVQVDIV
jgi:hypothetical protein